MPVAYLITVKPTPEGPKKFRLFNEASGEFAGDRFFRGSGGNVLWPFRSSDWWNYDTAKDASAAAVKLQAYLDGKESKKAKTKNSADHEKRTFD